MRIRFVCSTTVLTASHHVAQVARSLDENTGKRSKYHRQHTSRAPGTMLDTILRPIRAYGSKFFHRFGMFV